MPIDYDRINNTMGKMAYYLSNHNAIEVAVSGGGDSNVIVHIIATYFREYLPKIHFVFINTGLEYKATKNHLKYMAERYNITIEEVKAKPIPYVVKKFGMPIVSKEFSNAVNNENSKGVQYTIDRMSKKQYALFLYLLSHREIKISDFCCRYCKKRPAERYDRKHNIDMRILGMRKSEGGIRRQVIQDCFIEGKNGKADKYNPLWFWDDETKRYYIESEGIKLSDCYTVWGMERTGCVGCPFNSKIGYDLIAIKEHEPLMYKACMNLFGEAYRLMDKFQIHRHPILQEDNQLTIDNNEGEINNG